MYHGNRACEPIAADGLRRPVSRRDVLALARRFVVGGVAAASLGLSSIARGAAGPQAGPIALLPRVNGGINVHPLRRFDSVSDFTPPVIVPELVDLQIRSIYELGFDAIRITLSFSNFGPDFYASIPYVRAARALGIDVLGILGEFGPGFEITRALTNDASRVPVLTAYHQIFAGPVEHLVPGCERPGAFAVQILNEPANFFGLHPHDYVRYLLAPTARDMRAIAPEILVVGAAPVGNLNGVPRLRALIDAGLEDHCDRVAVHLYDPRILEPISEIPRLPVWVTESGARGPDHHLAWYTENFPEIRAAMPATERIYYYDLFDFEAGGYRLLEIVQEEEDRFDLRVASEALVSHLLDRVEQAAESSPHASYDDLIPDISAFFPTVEDEAIVAWASEAADLPSPIPES